jgi:hypothetical protein
MADDEDVAQKHALYFEQSKILLQGTILRAVTVVEETAESTDDDPAVRAELLDVIVLTQSCDIPKDSQPRLLVAEIQPYADMRRDREGTESATATYRKHLIRGTAVSDLLLPPCAALSMDDYLIVNFRELHLIFKHRVSSDDGYICLASPYRERLSQAYACFHMRVGVPTEPLHEFEKHKP